MPEGRKIPTWYYGVGAAVVAAAYFLYARNKAKNAATAPTVPAGTATAPVPADTTGATPAGNQAVTQADLVSLVQALQGPGSTPTPSTPTGPPATKAVGPGHVGYTPAAGTSETVSSGTYNVIDPNTAQQFVAAGGTVFWQPSPGIFQPANKGKNYLLSQPTQLFALSGK